MYLKCFVDVDVGSVGALFFACSPMDMCLQADLRVCLQSSLALRLFAEPTLAVITAEAWGYASSTSYVQRAAQWIGALPPPRSQLVDLADRPS